MDRGERDGYEQLLQVYAATSVHEAKDVLHDQKAKTMEHEHHLPKMEQAVQILPVMEEK